MLLLRRAAKIVGAYGNFGHCSHFSPIQLKFLHIGYSSLPVEIFHPKVWVGDTGATYIIKLFSNFFRAIELKICTCILSDAWKTISQNSLCVGILGASSPLEKVKFFHCSTASTCACELATFIVQNEGRNTGKWIPIKPEWAIISPAMNNFSGTWSGGRGGRSESELHK